MTSTTGRKPSPRPRFLDAERHAAPPASNFGAAVDAVATRPGRLRRIDLGAPGVEQLTRILRWRLGGALSDVADADLANFIMQLPWRLSIQFA
jgi:hypothetical protein